ncbi:probable protein phosphatase 2C 27 [Papaver somniferum]|nr:probable protein phosphatase 2C 27 [Papaver somniferum]
MCNTDSEEQVEEEKTMNKEKVWPLDDSDDGFMNTHLESLQISAPGIQSLTNLSSTLETISENKVVIDSKQNELPKFIPVIRSGECSDIGGRQYMEDTSVCISDLAQKFGCNSFDGEEPISFFGVFDGHGGKDAAHFVRDNLPRLIVEDSYFPLELEKVVIRSFKETDARFARNCILQSALSSGTTALTAMIFGRSLLVANVGDCRAVLSRLGVAVEMSKDHRPCCVKEQKRIESLGGYIDDGYLNGQLGITRALGDWHIKGLKSKETNGEEQIGPLSAEPELKLITLTKDDEFLVIASDGFWDVFRSENAIQFARRRLQEHNDVKLCCKEMVEEAIKRGAMDGLTMDNLTVLIVFFHSEPPVDVAVHSSKSAIKRSISAEGLQSLRGLLES